MAGKRSPKFAGNDQYRVDSFVFTSSITPYELKPDEKFSTRREVHVIGDSEDLSAVVGVSKNIDGGYGMTTREIHLAGIANTLILIEQNQREMFAALMAKIS